MNRVTDVLVATANNSAQTMPVPFGMCTRRTGAARYVPDFARSNSDWRLASRFFVYGPNV